MKKMKLFLMMFIAAASVCGFVSCDDDDDNGSSASIVGTWECWEDSEDFYTYIFSADGSYTEVGQDKGNPFFESGTYTYEGTTLTLFDSSYPSPYDEFRYTATISGDKLILDDGLYSTRVFIRKKS